MRERGRIRSARAKRSAALASKPNRERSEARGKPPPTKWEAPDFPAVGGGSKPEFSSGLYPPKEKRSAASAPPVSESHREPLERSRFWGRRSGIQFRNVGGLFKAPRKSSGGAGNRTRVREGSPRPSFTCVVAASPTTEFVDSATTYLSRISVKLSRASSLHPALVVDALTLPRQSRGRTALQVFKLRERVHYRLQL